jgi:hypothetical protein
MGEKGENSPLTGKGLNIGGEVSKAFLLSPAKIKYFYLH